MNIRQKEFSGWLRTEQGAELLASEQDYLNVLLENIYGCHALLLADPAQANLADALQVDDCLLIHPSDSVSFDWKQKFVSAQYSALPIESDSMQVVLMPHVLEFVSNSHKVLREVERVMRPEGHLVIVGFNPMSWRGLFRFFSTSGMWSGQFRSMGRVQDWLNLLGFEIVKHSYHNFLPINKDSHWLEKWGKKIIPILAGTYIIVAKKQMIGMTPQRPEWKRQSTFIKKGMVKPAARDMCD